MDQDLASILTGNLASSSQLSHQRTNVVGENLVQGLGVIQGLGTQIAHAATISSVLMADDAQALGGLRTSVHVPVADK